MRTLLISLATTIAVTAPATPAAALDEPVGVNGCSASAPSPHNRNYCDFATQAGEYVLELTSGARFAFARVFCNEQLPAVAVAVATNGVFPPPYLEVDRWDVDPSPATKIGPLPGGNCILQVAAGNFSPTYGTGGAFARVYRRP